MHILQLNIWWLFGQNLHPSEKTHTKVSCPGNSLHYMGGGSQDKDRLLKFTI